jgi:hypothetical protein
MYRFSCTIGAGKCAVVRLFAGTSSPGNCRLPAVVQSRPADDGGNKKYSWLNLREECNSLATAQRCSQILDPDGRPGVLTVANHRQFFRTLRFTQGLSAMSEAAPKGKNKPDRAAKRAEKKNRAAAEESAVDVPALEKRVHLAELRAREIEAQVRYLEASAKHRDLKSEKREKKRRDKPGKSVAE